MPRTEERAIRAEKKEQRKGAKDIDEDMDGMDSETEASFFDSVMDTSTPLGPNGETQDILFSQLNLSRPLLRAIEASGYVAPTPVQSKVIPLAMAGRDVCASAVTGSGKTAAFVLPFLERLLYRPKDQAAIRVLVVSPTRELATQTYDVLKKLAQFTDITCVIICGGNKDVKSQEVLLRNRPDIAICTPGRIIDHLRNSQSVNIDDLDVLVLDEVDRLLDMGFQEEVEELVRFCPTARQTLLFSATMTPKVDDLAKLSLRRPVRVKTAISTHSIAPRLIQEFVKVRSDDEKESMLAALVCRSFNKRAIVFFETKKDAHRFCIILNLLNVKATELHGDISQAQRYLSLQKFKDGLVDVMVCTDVAARGLDIQGIQTVLNAEMPRSSTTYVHRVGRTARAGNGGRSITLVSDARRKVMKEVLKGEACKLSTDGGQVLSRIVPATVINQYSTNIARVEIKIAQAHKEDKLNAKIEIAEREANRAENFLLHEDEIASRPARTWYQTETQKQEIKDISKAKVKEEQIAAQFGKDQVENILNSELKSKQLAKADDYRRELDEKSKGDHRLSRKKRRRLEALADLEEEEAVSARSVNSAPKRSKMTAREAAENLKNKSVNEYGLSKKKNGKSENGKVIRPKFAVGGLDQDFADWGEGKKNGGLTKKQRLQDAEDAKFTDFNPDMKLKKGGKLGSNKFKSKSKHKRR
jgi:ATP-dependent RNA helicase DDX27